MKIVEPKVEYWEQTDPLKHIAKCGHISYMAETKDDAESNQKFYDRLVANKHFSVLRHCSKYYIVDTNREGDYYTAGYLLSRTLDSPYINYTIKGSEQQYRYYVATNLNFLLEHSGVECTFKPYEVTPQEFMKECPELMRFTFCLTTQISTTRELNRMNGDVGITEMSTRYIKFGGKVEPSIVRPYWLTDDTTNKSTRELEIEDYYLLSCREAFDSYKGLLDRGVKPQDARGILPLDTLTKVVYTMPISKWRDIINMRYYDSTGPAHGNCHVVIGMVKEELEKLGYTFKDPKIE